ncbi:MAG TPA: nuclear transport factor 2 family protein [Candidatus Limnocylindria bacterium]|nr:nuclear transport factor 2 family protein [Candidatus Limnocylindria bacterium]
MSMNDGGPSKRSSDAAVAVIRQLSEAFNARDEATISSLLADNIEWHEIGRAEPIRGKAALAERFSGALPKWQITPEVHDIVANDDHVVMLVTATATMDGRSFTYRVAEIYHVRDGKVTARWAFSDDTAAINEFFAGT